MEALVYPKTLHRRWINQAVKAEINLCFTCGSCTTECPVNRATNRLDPRRLVWMANLGLMDELIRVPEIWLCLGCRKCSHVCPMTVKPAMLIAFLRWEAVRTGAISQGMSDDRRRLQDRLHRERASVVNALLAEQFRRIGTSNPVASMGAALPWKRFEQFHGHPTNLASCFACGECSNACPVCVDRSVLDPLLLVRGTLFGYGSDLALSPAPWVCLQCESCSRACSHNVQGHLVALALREAAEELGWVNSAFLGTWADKDRKLFRDYADSVTQSHRHTMEESSNPV